ncbi:peptidylprolyl isomerase [Ruegeria aquimaris]|uniref:Parvulin-like PPIase n=1 Tax=Ruegeria aquimaris TaxID=2984333 RepID=A0ABT3AM92_9RHOB|nr:peptidylprolyl isomerase [Ruegeria sp. XHP0148]MCV2889778.1 peptidylprolyl isomerase [Ruegeria sp. XHP0148]
MPKGLTFLPSLALALVLALPVSAETKAEADTVVARVNGEEITLGHMIIARATLPQQYQQLPDEVLFEGILDQLIQQTLLKQVQNDRTPLQVVLSLENEERSLLAGETIDQIMASVTTDEALQAAYDAKYADGFGEDEFNASHILVPSEEEAKSVKDLIDNGADFAATAREKSTGPSGPNGGELGWFGAGAMVPEFEAAVMELEVGKVSAPVQTQFGWHVIKLNDKRKSTAPELDEVREELAGQIQQDAIEARLADLTRDGNIEKPDLGGIGPDVLRQFELVQE